MVMGESANIERFGVSVFCLTVNTSDPSEMVRVVRLLHELKTLSSISVTDGEIKRLSSTEHPLNNSLLKVVSFVDSETSASEVSSLNAPIPAVTTLFGISIHSNESISLKV